MDAQEKPDAKHEQQKHVPVRRRMGQKADGSEGGEVRRRRGQKADGSWMPKRNQTPKQE